jgi:hypothetical protein
VSRCYEGLLAVLREPAVSSGEWRLLDCRTAWEGNWTSDCFIAWCWQAGEAERVLVVVNYADHQSQCYVPLPWPDLHDRAVRLKDLLSDAVYDRDGDRLIAPGFYLDLPPWGRHAFALTLGGHACAQQ